jgi:hypothetical protein
VYDNVKWWPTELPKPEAAKTGDLGYEEEEGVEGDGDLMKGLRDMLKEEAWFGPPWDWARDKTSVRPFLLSRLIGQLVLAFHLCPMRRPFLLVLLSSPLLDISLTPSLSIRPDFFIIALSRLVSFPPDRLFSLPYASILTIGDSINRNNVAAFASHVGHKRTMSIPPFLSLLVLLASSPGWS